MRVKINVGGQIFETDSENLQSSEYFKVLFARWSGGSEEIFIDRDPKAFAAILNWIRGPYNLPEKYIPELEFYGIVYEIETEPETNTAKEIDLEKYKNFSANQAHSLKPILQSEHKEYPKTPIKGDYTNYEARSEEQSGYYTISRCSEIVDKMRLIISGYAEIDRVELMANGFVLGSYDSPEIIDNECNIPFFKAGFICPSLAAYTEHKVRVIYKTEPKDAVLITEGGGMSGEKKEALIKQHIVSLITCRRMISGEGSIIETHQLSRIKGNKRCIELNAWSQGELVTVDFLLIVMYNVALKLEELDFTYFEQLPDGRIDLIAKKPVDKWELTIEWDAPIYISNGMCGSRFL